MLLPTTLESIKTFQNFYEKNAVVILGNRNSTLILNDLITNYNVSMFSV